MQNSAAEGKWAGLGVAAGRQLSHTALGLLGSRQIGWKPQACGCVNLFPAQNAVGLGLGLVVLYLLSSLADELLTAALLTHGLSLKNERGDKGPVSGWRMNYGHKSSGGLVETQMYQPDLRYFGSAGLGRGLVKGGF